jgi:hypothetical protein
MGQSKKRTLPPAQLYKFAISKDILACGVGVVPPQQKKDQLENDKKNASLLVVTKNASFALEYHLKYLVMAKK